MEPKVVEEVLTDGSKVYNVYTEEVKFACIDENAAINLASVIYHGVIGIETIR